MSERCRECSAVVDASVQFRMDGPLRRWRTVCAGACERRARERLDVVAWPSRYCTAQRRDDDRERHVFDDVDGLRRFLAAAGTDPAAYTFGVYRPFAWRQENRDAWLGSGTCGAATRDTVVGVVRDARATRGSRALCHVGLRGVGIVRSLAILEATGPHQWAASAALRPHVVATDGIAADGTDDEDVLVAALLALVDAVQPQAPQGPLAWQISLDRRDDLLAWCLPDADANLVGAPTLAAVEAIYYDKLTVPLTSRLPVWRDPIPKLKRRRSAVDDDLENTATPAAKHAKNNS
jgi:hypothetical protein